jgi:hypothetical protein
MIIFNVLLCLVSKLTKLEVVFCQLQHIQHHDFCYTYLFRTTFCHTSTNVVPLHEDSKSSITYSCNHYLRPSQKTLPLSLNIISQPFINSRIYLTEVNMITMKSTYYADQEWHRQSQIYVLPHTYIFYFVCRDFILLPYYVSIPCR